MIPKRNLIVKNTSWIDQKLPRLLWNVVLQLLRRIKMGYTRDISRYWDKYYKTADMDM